MQGEPTQGRRCCGKAEEGLLTQAWSATARPASGEALRSGTNRPSRREFPAGAKGFRSKCIPLNFQTLFLLAKAACVCSETTP